MSIVQDENLVEKLRGIWNRVDAYILLGGKQYRVVTPNGEDKPEFIEQDLSSAYATTSTGLVTPDNPKRPKVGKLNRNTDIG